MKRSLHFMALLAFIALAFVVGSMQASAAEPTMPVAQLREDARILRGALEESQVGLDWFLPKPEFDRRFQTVYDGLDRPMTAQAFHRRLLPLVAALGHGHTTLSLPTQGVGYRMRQLSRQGRYFPFSVRVLAGRLYVVSDLSEGALVAPGAEIVSIDGRHAAELIQEMRAYTSADGANDTFKLHQLGPGYRFHFLLHLLHGPSDTYAVGVRLAAGAPEVRVDVPAVSPARMATLHRERTGREIDAFPPAYRYRTLGERVGLLTVSSFYEGLAGPGAPGFEAFLASTFRKIKDEKIEDLIVDVRGNEGGDGSYPHLLYAYLADRPFASPGPTTVASASVSFLRYAADPSPDIKAFAARPNDFVSRAEDGSWRLREEFAADRCRERAPRPDRFTGRLHVLVDGGAFSATNDFVDLVYRYHRREKRAVRFVGEQNGGDDTFGRTSGGQVLTLVLPNSKQSLGIPLLGFTQHFATETPPAVIPDDRVEPSIRDVIAGRDRELEFVREAIAQSRRPRERNGAEAIDPGPPPASASARPAR